MAGDSTKKSEINAKQLYISDPKALHHILVKLHQDDEHRKHGKMMNPVFSVSHLRNMLPIFYEITNKVHVAIRKDLVDGPREINILRWMTRAALEMVGQTGLGYSFDSLSDEESENDYTKSVKELASMLQEFKFSVEFLLATLIKMGTPKLRRALLDLVPSKKMKKLIRIVDILDKTSNEILDGKTQALEKGDEAVEQQVGQGKDIISILMNANMAASERDRLEKKEVLGQLMTPPALFKFPTNFFHRIDDVRWPLSYVVED
ncbi:hypothetical protein H0H81_000604 [Sphagnurus paluster]|uniref:Uncharacterized protein n=1 Tax=Sphagnurus paluster TaxID=117069 RepID=A0A9P7FTF8_9AGAR|nr:hypothetical protein H0H81_000604 [Sphagnurus paluster]